MSILSVSYFCSLNIEILRTLARYSLSICYIMEQNMSGTGKDHTSDSKKSKQEENNRNHFMKEAMPGSELWSDGLICAFEYVQVQRKPILPRSYSKIHCANKIDGENMKKQVPTSRVTEAFSPKASGNNIMESASLTELGSHRISSLDDGIDRKSSQSDHLHAMERLAGSRWVPIGWARISELVQTVHVDIDCASQQFDIMDEENDLTTADLAAPYWERPGGPRWWCHVAPDHPSIDAWLRNAQWLHPAISIALRDESRLISDRMKYLFYEVPFRVAGGLLFELVGQSAGDPYIDEDDIPVVLRSWQANSFLITALHIKGSASSINVLGITEVQEQLLAGGCYSPRSVHEVIGRLATHLARWDDRLFRKSIFGAADEVELMFMNRRHQEDLKIFSIILNQEIRKLSRQVIRVKWALHAREEIVFELLQHLRGNVSKSLLERLREDTREMLEEQEAVRGRLFTIQGVMKETVRAWLQDRSLRVTHNLAVFGGCGLVLSVITGLFGINVDGMPGADNTPYAFGLFAAILVALGVVLISVGLFCLGLKKPITEQQIKSKKLELQELINKFQHEAKTHAQVRKNFSRQNLPPTSADIYGDSAGYLLFN